MSASRITIAGFFPPSSSEICARIQFNQAIGRSLLYLLEHGGGLCGHNGASACPASKGDGGNVFVAHNSITSALSIAVDDVQNTVRNPSSTRQSDLPNTDRNTHRWDASASREAVEGVSSDGLATIVHPAASAGATFQESK